MISFQVHGTPAPKGSPRVVTRGRGGIPLPYPRVLKDSPKTESWHAQVALQAMIAMRGRQMFVGRALRVGIGFQLLRPAGHYRKDGSLKPSAPSYPQVKPDLDKLVRATLDPLIGICFDEDSRIVQLDASKTYAPAGQGTGAGITVEAWG